MAIQTYSDDNARQTVDSLLNDLESVVFDISNSYQRVEDGLFEPKPVLSEGCQNAIKELSTAVIKRRLEIVLDKLRYRRDALNDLSDRIDLQLGKAKIG
ncbi:MAG: hypothetical protein H6Q67_1326 [Firmicutes bacterium]|nr:hypothetical protein [Bacillota bacterium]